MALPLLYLIWYCSKLFTISPIDNLFLSAYSWHGLMNTLTLGLAMFIGIMTVRRDIYRHAYDWMQGLPLSHFMRISVKYIVGMLYLTSFSVIAGVVYAIASHQLGIPASLYMEHARYFMVSYELSYLITYALAMLLAILIPNRVIYLIGFCTWMFGTFFMQIYIIERNYWNILTTFHLSQLYASASYDNDVWNFNLISEQLIYSHVFVAIFAVMLLVIAIMLLDMKRPTSYRKFNYTASVLAVILTIVSFLPYADVWNKRKDNLQQILNNPNVKSFWELKQEADSDEEIFSFPIEKYDVSVVKDKDDTLHVTALLSIPVQGIRDFADLKLTLNHNFVIDTVKVGGKEVSFHQEYDWVTIPLTTSSKDNISVELRYGGQIYDDPLRDKGPDGLFAFVKGDNAFLPYYTAWYPLAGQHHIYLREASLESYFQRNVSIPYAADWQLSIKGFEATVLTGLNKDESSKAEGEQRFSGNHLHYVSMLGAELVEVKEAGLPAVLYTTPYDAARAKYIAEIWKDTYDYFESWLGPIQHKITTVGIFNKRQYLEPIRQGNLSIIFRNQDEGYTGYYLMNQMMLGTKDGYSSYQTPREDVRTKIRGLIWYVQQREVLKYSDEEILNHYSDSRMVGELIDHGSATESSELGLRMREQVAVAIDQGKLAQVKEVLRYFYEQGLEIPLQQSTQSTEGNEGQSKPVSYETWQKVWEQVMQK